MVFIGVVLISGAIGAGAYGEDPLLGAILGVLTAIAYSLFILILRQGNSDERRPAGPLFDATFTGCIFSALGGVAGDLDWTPGLESTAWLVTLALTSQVLGWLLISVSLPRLPAVITSIVLMLQPVATVFLGVVLLDEAPAAVQLSGVAVVLAGVAFATVRPRTRWPPRDPAAADRGWGGRGGAGLSRTFWWEPRRVGLSFHTLRLPFWPAAGRPARGRDELQHVPAAYRAPARKDGTWSAATPARPAPS